MNRIANRQLAVLEACDKANAKLARMNQYDAIKQDRDRLLAALCDLINQCVNYANNDDAELPDTWQAEQAMEGRAQ